MSSTTTNIATSPGGSDILQETTPLGEQGSSVGSRDNSKTAGVPSQALVGTHVSAMRCDTTALETGKKMDSTERTGTESEREHRRTIDIAVLNESELLTMIKGYVNSMNDFAKRTRNVHKELKDTLANTGLVLNQYLKIKSSTSTGKKVNDSSTQTEDIPIDNAQSETIQSKKTSSREATRRECKDAATNTASPQAVPEKQRKQQQQQQKQQQQQQQQRRKGKKRQRLQQSQQQESPQQLQQEMQKQQPQKQQPQQQQHQQRQPQKQQTWSEVVRKTRPPKPARQPRSNADQVALLRKRTPRSMAVTIDRPAEGGSLASVMKKVSGSINLQSLGVKVLTTRKTRAGGILLEVEGNEKATLLAGKIRDVVGDAARVRLPETRTPVLLLGVPEWAEAEDVVAGVTQAGVTGVTSENLIIRKNSGGRGEFVASLHLPLKDAITLAEKNAVSVGWTRCRVKLLTNNQPTCFRCQGKGHLAAECRGEAKPRRCHRCRKDDHLVKDCTQQKQTQQKQQPQTSRSETPAEVNGAV
ncbi:uncharacterized protein LOC132930053 [Rhopalosiphum padi]|uniref:uncharacterized protein LOC132930053 n=1 Tax=Rhopalosiphum padi TaxID=40932 RepID=UPI00298E84CD|nr:uncharacterized protein LOC132930053 [Rhopalosiphum padi]